MFIPLPPNAEEQRRRLAAQKLKRMMEAQWNSPYLADSIKTAGYRLPQHDDSFETLQKIKIKRRRKGMLYK